MATLDTLTEIANQFAPEHQVTQGKWFGKPCLKSNNKVFVVLWGKSLVFKLTGNAHAEALEIPGAHLFDPRGKGQAMKEWVQIPAAQSVVWSSYARHAFDYLTSLS
jgi:hypothetical protein